MTATMEKLSTNQVKLTVTVGAAEFDQGMNTAYHKLKGRLSVPGFRKGKAPRKVIENYYGQGVFYEEAFNAVLPDSYDKAVEEAKISPVDQPEIDIENIGAGEDCVYTATVYVRPEVTLGQYKGLAVRPAKYQVTDEQVEEEIHRARERSARWEDADRPAQKGDMLTIDYEGMVDGKPFSGGKSEGMSLELGSGTFIPGFEEQLEGVEKDTEKDLSVKFPEDYRAKELAGQDAVFHVKVSQIKRKEMPEVDDEFAKEVSEFDTLDEYKSDIRAKLTEQAKNAAENNRDDEIIDKACENATVDIPAPMVERQISQIVNDMAMRMSYQGLQMEDFLKYTGQTMEQLRETYRVQAERQVKAELVLDAIRQAENVQVEESELEAEVAKMAEDAQKSIDELRSTLNDTDMDYFRNMIVTRKVIELLRGAAVDAPEEEPKAQEDKKDQ